MAKQTTKPAGKKVVATVASGKPKTSGAAVAKIAKSPPEKKPVAKKPAVKKPVTKAAEKSIKTATAKSTAPVVKKAAVPVAEKKIAAKKTPVKKAAEKKAKPAASRKTLAKPSLEERYRMVELAAYFIAEQHGFQGHTDEYWAAAENQIAARLGL